jgi:ubiquinone/menaquinone biosynthesis C-methylase UbiE
MSRYRIITNATRIGGGLLWLALSMLSADGLTGGRGFGFASAAAQEQSVRPDVNKEFLAEQLDLQMWRERFEVESREVFQHREAIVAAIGLTEGQQVADVGAGTGAFMAPLTKAVGSAGSLFAVDISPNMVQFLRRRADEEAHPNVTVVLCNERSCTLPANSIDAALIVDTYHHFEYPQDTLASLHRALRPEGTLVIVDFDKIEGVSREWVMGHVRADRAQVIGELEAAGFQRIDARDVPGLTENYLIRFRKRP